jgi:hypothetical protein
MDGKSKYHPSVGAEGWLKAAACKGVKIEQHETVFCCYGHDMYK